LQVRFVLRTPAIVFWLGSWPTTCQPRRVGSHQED